MLLFASLPLSFSSVQTVTGADFTTSDGLEVNLDSTGTLTISKWNNESWYKINMGSIPSSTTEPTKGVYEQQYLNYKTRIYGIDNGIEYEIELSKIPTSNVFNFYLDSQNVVFTYQPPLTSEFTTGFIAEFNEECNVTSSYVIGIKTGTVYVHRPENVVGSYAVYGMKNNGQYGSGKLSHVYRPVAIDSAGNRMFGDLVIKDKLMTVSINSEWLKNAVYPVIIDPTFGDTTTSATSTLVPALSILVIKATPLTSGYISSMSVYGTDVGIAGYIRSIVYNSDGSEVANSPSSGAIFSTGGVSWKVANYLLIYPQVTAYSQYWIGIVVDSTSGVNVRYDAGTTDYMIVTPITSFEYPPINIGSVATGQRNYSIYATYTDQITNVASSVISGTSTVITTTTVIPETSTASNTIIVGSSTVTCTTAIITKLVSTTTTSTYSFLTTSRTASLTSSPNIIRTGTQSTTGTFYTVTLTTAIWSETIPFSTTTVFSKTFTNPVLTCTTGRSFTRTNLYTSYGQTTIQLPRTTAYGGIKYTMTSVSQSIIYTLSNEDTKIITIPAAGTLTGFETSTSTLLTTTTTASTTMLLTTTITGGQTKTYFVKSFTLITGTSQTGTLTHLTVIDSKTVIFLEVVDGFNWEFRFEDLPIFSSNAILQIVEYYMGDNHPVILQDYNYNEAQWETETTWSAEVGYVTHVVTLNTDIWYAGNMLFRLNHPPPGDIDDVEFIDYIALIAEAAGESTSTFYTSETICETSTYTSVTTTFTTESTYSTITGGAQQRTVPSTISAIYGTYISGNVESVQTKDGSYYIVQQANQTQPNFIVKFDFINIPLFYNLKINMYGKYITPTAPNINLEFYDVFYDEWTDFQTGPVLPLPVSGVDGWFNSTMQDWVSQSGHALENGVVMFRLVRDNVWQQDAELDIDYIEMEYNYLAASTTTTCETNKFTYETTTTTALSTESTLTTVTGGVKQVQLPDSVTAIAGVYQEGSISSILTVDGDYYAVEEALGAEPNLDIEIRFNNVPIFYDMSINMYGSKTGGEADPIFLEYWDVHYGTWEILSNLTVSVTDDWNNSTMLNWVSQSGHALSANNSVLFRYHHHDTGHANCTLNIDYMEIKYYYLGASTTTTCETYCETTSDTTTVTSTDVTCETGTFTDFIEERTSETSVVSVYITYCDTYTLSSTSTTCSTISRSDITSTYTSCSTMSITEVTSTSTQCLTTTEADYIIEAAQSIASITVLIALIVAIGVIIKVGTMFGN